MGRQITFLIVLGLAVGMTSAQAGLIQHWKLDEDTAAGDTIAADSIGGLSGTIHGARSVPGKLGNALSFDGSDDVVTILDFVPPRQGTIAFWIDPGFGSSKQRLFGAGGDYEVIVYSTGIVRNELFAAGSGTLQSKAGSVEPGRWTHVAVTYAYDSTGPSTALHIYVDGNLDVVGTAGEPSVPSDTTLLLSHRAGASGGEYYGGLLDDIRIYDHILSEAEIKALAVPPRFTARDPSPPDGAVHEDMCVTLSWSSGDFAASHDVYLGDNFDDVNNRTSGTFRGNQTSTSLIIGFPGYPYPEGLVSGTTYYWRTDEVNETEPNSPWKGSLWSFTTANFLVVDDFESYNDIDPPDPESNRIFEAWLDGYEIPTNGALVGNELPPYAEQSIVHSGIQSMPYFYDNSVGYSEATLTLTYPRDWTENGVNTLTIWFRGNSANAAETLYVALNGNAIVTNDNPNAAQVTTWTQWNIDLQAFADQGVNLANVNTIGIGFGNRSNPQAGGSGTMYFDDIRLYPPAP